jgi:hypothetical protein
VRCATAICLALALTTADERRRAPLLAVALVAGTVWLALESRRPGGMRSWPVAVLALGIAGLFSVPALLLVAVPAINVDAGRPLSGGLVLFAIALMAIHAGLVAGRAVPLPRVGEWIGRVRSPTGPDAPKRTRRVIVGWIVAVAALGAFLHAAGGPSRYFANLDQTGASTAGLTYLIWGVLAAKFVTVAELARRWQSGQRANRVLAIAVVVSLGLAGAIGARILVVVALAQLALLALVLRGTSRRSIVAAAVTGLAGVACIVGLGELRRWQSLNTGTSFPSYLTTTGLPNLPRTYVNQYADGIRVGVLARAAVPALAPFEHGTELLRVAAQPIPGSARPQLTRPAGLRAIFTTAGGTSGNAFPLPVVGFLQLGAWGAALAGLLAGLLVAGLERGLRRARDPGVILGLIAATTGLVMVMRGSLPQATAFALMDVIGFVVGARWVLGRQRGARSWRPRPATSTPSNAACPATTPVAASAAP